MNFEIIVKKKEKSEVVSEKLIKEVEINSPYAKIEKMKGKTYSLKD